MKTISRFFSLLTLASLALVLCLQDIQPAKADTSLDQTITVVTPAPVSAAYGESFTVAATATSGLDVAYSAQGDCTNVGAIFTMTSGVGVCTVQYNQAGDSAYNPAPQVIELVTAQPAVVTVTADAKNKSHAEPDPALTYTITAGALVGTDDFTGALARDPGEAVGDYVITQGTLALSGDYDLTYIGANLTITSPETATPTSTRTSEPDTVTPAPSPTTAPHTATPTASPTTTTLPTPTRTPTMTGIRSTSLTLFVSTIGNNQGGANTCANVASPCRTIQQAITKATSGDNIYVTSGTFNGIGASPIVTINKNISISGGWDSGFTTQSSLTILDGQDTRSDVEVNSGITAVIEKFIVTNSKASGIKNLGALTINYSMIYKNNKPDGSDISATNGGGIYNTGTLVVANSAIYGNYANGRGGGGIFNTGSLTVGNSTITNNYATTGGGIMYTPTGYAGTAPSAVLRNVTLSGNNADYGSSIYRAADIDPVFLQDPVLYNSILANNNCHGSLTSANNNLIQTSGCAINGTYASVNPLLGAFSTANGYFPLLHGSPAIDAGSPVAPGSGGEACEAIDQLGTTRPTDGDEDTVSICDIGAYEADPSVASAVSVANAIDVDDGSPQSAEFSTVFSKQLSVLVKDQLDNPISGITVTFTAPASGASGTFGDSGTNITTAMTNVNGIATATVFTANSGLGGYPVNASVLGIPHSAQFYLANSIGPVLYVSPLGNDSNTCGLPTDACLTINGALEKATAGNTIKVAVGTYTYPTNTTNFVVSINTSISLSGGWDTAFTEQNGMSTTDGQGIYSGISVNSTATLERFVIQNSVVGISNAGNLTLNNSIVRNNNGFNGGGISNFYGVLTLNDSSVTNNIYGIASHGATLTLNNSSVTDNSGGGISDNYSTITLNKSTVSGNTSSSQGGGIHTGHSDLTLNNSTISGNTAGQGGGGISSYASRITINYSTISGNNASYRGGGGINNTGGTAQGYITITNSIVALNTGYPNPDCAGYVISGGYNLIGDTNECSYTAGVGDLLNIDPKLVRLMGSPGYIPLLPDSPAINAANPATCLATDGRGVARPQGSRCDIGSYEYTTPGPAISIGYFAGSNQNSASGAAYSIPLTGYAIDNVGSPVPGVVFTFTAPSSGPGGIFAKTKTNTTTAITDNNGLASASTFTANNAPGGYDVSATVTDLSSSVTFSLINLPIPTPLSPASEISVAQPAYRWAKVIGATQYRYEVRIGAKLLYTKTVSASVCGNTICSNVPTNKLVPLVYRWRVMAMVGGAWKDFSVYKSFSVIDVKPGFWSGPGMEFYITHPSIQGVSVVNFAVYINIKGCGKYKIIHKLAPKPRISNRQFRFSYTYDGLYANGVFVNMQRASGKLGFYYLYIPGCGTIFGGPFPWTATWKNSSQPTTFIPAEVIPLLVNPQLEIDPGSYTVERVNP